MSQEAAFHRDTDLRHAPAFPSTCWSRLTTRPFEGGEGGEDATGAAAGESRQALDILAQRYWKPIAGYVRTRWARTDDEAREATQEFFVWMMEKQLLARADRERGSFRGLVKRCLENFLVDRERRRAADKRGGGLTLEPLDAPGRPGEKGAEDGGLADPGASEADRLDALWRRELLAQATQALEEELLEKGKPKVFAVFRDYFLAETDVDYALVADRHGISKVDVSNYLALAKRCFRAHLRAAVVETVRDDDQLQAELAWLFGEPSA